MSAPAIKSSMPGVGGTPPTTGHSMLPMNMMAQKVVQSSETNAMKPTGISYVTLQPPSQPLSLVQDHKSQVYPQTTPTASTTTTCNTDKDTDTEKTIPNGLEVAKLEPEQAPAKTVVETAKTTVESSALVPEQISQSQPIALQVQSQPQLEVSEPQSEIHLKSQTPPPNVEEKTIEIDKSNQTKIQNFSSVQPQVKIEEKKVSPLTTVSSISSSLKETSEETSVKSESKSPLTPHKTEEPLSKTPETPPKPPKLMICPAKVEHSTAAQSMTINPPKAEPKSTTSIPSRANKRKLKQVSESRAQNQESSSKSKRKRRKTEPFQSPLPELAMIVKTLSKPSPTKAQDDKLIVFYKNEFLAVRNTEGSFYVCQAMQNIYKSSRRIRIRWLSQDKTNGEIYSPDFYDFTDFDCILTNLNLNKIDKNKFQLSKFELLRTENILKRAIDVEAGVSEKPSVTEEHPDGLDLSLYKDESQLKKRKKGGASGKQKRLRKKIKKSTESSEDDESESESEESDKEESAADKKKPVPVKKRSSNKTLAIAKSVGKGPSRAERAMNRGSKGTDSVNNVLDNKTEKKMEPKKAVPKAPNNNGAGASRVTKVRGNSQSSTESKSNSSRPKRGSNTPPKPRGRA